MPTNPEEKEQSWKNNPPRLQAALQSYSNQNGVALAQKQPQGPLERNRAPRDTPAHLRPTDAQPRRPEYTWRRAPQHATLGKRDSRTKMNEIRTLPHTTHQSKPRMAEGTKYKTQHHTTPRREDRESLLTQIVAIFS